MIYSINYSSLATSLCTEILTFSELKQLCLARGFPVTGSSASSASKNELAIKAACRFLEPIGVAEAMASLEPLWLKVLHLVAMSRDEPVAVAAFRRLIEPDKKNDWDCDWRSLWRKVTSGLLSKGLALALDGQPPPYEKSRYARYHLIVPSVFIPFIPPFPMETKSFVSGDGLQLSSSLDNVLSTAMQHFVRNGADKKPGKNESDSPNDLASLIAKHFSISDGILSLSSITDSLTPASVRSLVMRTWLESLCGQRRGEIAFWLLSHLPSHTGCTSKSLLEEMNILGCNIDFAQLHAFLNNGLTAGLLERSESQAGESCYRLAEEQQNQLENRLEISAIKEGVLVNIQASSIVSVMQAATISRASLTEKALILTPDPLRTGRFISNIPPEIVAKLTEISPVFNNTVNFIKKRLGKVLVHEGLSVLRVTDIGLRALFIERFPEVVRVLEGDYLACLTDSLATILALAKKEGFVPRRHQ